METGKEVKEQAIQGSSSNSTERVLPSGKYEAQQTDGICESRQSNEDHAIAKIRYVILKRASKMFS